MQNTIERAIKVLINNKHSHKYVPLGAMLKTRIKN